MRAPGPPWALASLLVAGVVGAGGAPGAVSAQGSEPSVQRALFDDVLSPGRRGRRVAPVDAVVADAVWAAIRRRSLAGAWFREAEDKRPAWEHVSRRLQERGMPWAFAAIPMVESCFRVQATSTCCAKGWWQLMPEVGARAAEGVPGVSGRDGVAGCRLKGGGWWSPGAARTPPSGACRRAAYVNESGCRLSGCDEDVRTDPLISTELALGLLLAAMEDPRIAATGESVELAIASHHAGLDDADFGVARSVNVARVAERGSGTWLAQGVACRGAAGCGPGFAPDTPGYVVEVLAQAVLLRCHFARLGAEDPPGWCSEVPLPTTAAIANARGPSGCPR